MYVTSEYLLVGDYIGSGSVGLANLQVIEQDLSEMEGIEVAQISTSPELYTGDAHVLWFEGAYGTRQALFLEASDNEAFNEWRNYIMESLEAHPILDDDLHSEIDYEWFSDALELLADEVSSQFFDELEMSQDEVAVALIEYDEDLRTSYSEEYTGGYISLSKGEMEDIKDFLIKYQETA